MYRLCYEPPRYSPPLSFPVAPSRLIHAPRRDESSPDLKGNFVSEWCRATTMTRHGGLTGTLDTSLVQRRLWGEHPIAGQHGYLQCKELAPILFVLT